MGKTNLFTLFITVIAVVIIAEVLVNEYGTIGDGAASILAPDQEQETSDDSEPSSHDWNVDFDELTGEGSDTEEETPGTISFDDAAESFGADSRDADEDVSEASQVKAEISFGLIGLSGFQNVTLQRVPFSGILFERIDLRDFQSVPVVQQNLLQNNKERIAMMYEFHGDNELLANEVYLYIKEKARAGLNVGVNETDDYGDGSFYVNYTDISGSAFLVVKIRESVYALTYEKGLHSFMESLIRYLNT